MRLADLRESSDGRMPDDARAELAALDAALAGEDVPAGMEGLETLAADMRSERVESDQDFASALDAWAAGGFERGQRPALGAGAPGAPKTKRGWLSSSGPRRFAPVMAAMATLVVVAVSVSQIEQGGGESADVAVVDDGGDPERAGSDGAGLSFDADVGSFNPERESRGAAYLRSRPEVEESLLQGALKDSRDTLLGNSGARAALDSGGSGGSDDRPGFQRGQDERQVERDAQLELAAPVGDVPDVTNEAIQVVEGANGVVLSSRVSGTDDAAVARLNLEVPTERLDDVIANLSDLADVKSRTEQAQDITQPFVTAEDRLIGLEAERVNLALRIEDALTDDEVASLQAQLASVNRRIAEARSDLRRLELRANFSTVQLEITSSGAQADEDDGWSLGEALDDAGRVVEVAAGIALISGAVLLPISIIAAIAFLAHGAASRRARERALRE